jgi:ABC-2 type transport system ATP-binding protein
MTIAELHSNGSALSNRQDTTLALATERLSKRFGQTQAVSDVSLRIADGEVYGMLGPNGSGKTTTLRMILGLVRPDAGEIVLLGQPNTAKNAYRQSLRATGALVERPAFYPFLDARDNLYASAVGGGLRATDAIELRISYALETVGLAGRKESFAKYSLGMKQRLGIAAALLSSPRLVILDEPTNGLDPNGIADVRQIIQRLPTLGTTVIVSSHVLPEIEQVCTSIGIMYSGRLVVQGPVKELLTKQEQVLIRFEREADVQDAYRLLHDAIGQYPWLESVELISEHGGQRSVSLSVSLLRLAMPVRYAARVTAALASQELYVAELRHQHASLEHLFMAVTDRAAGPVSERQDTENNPRTA